MVNPNIRWQRNWSLVLIPYTSIQRIFLNELLEKGFVYTWENRVALRSLQRHFPSIKRSQFKGKSIYYLKDKNDVALREMLKQNTSRVINYRELSNMSKTFHTDLSKPEKKRFFGKKGQISRRKKQRSNEKKVYVYK